MFILPARPISGVYLASASFFLFSPGFALGKQNESWPWPNRNNITLGERIAKTAYSYVKRRVSTTERRAKVL